MKHAKVGDAWLHVETLAANGGPTVVYINSLGSDLRIWDGVVEQLAGAGFGALRFDLRGHGLSDLGTPPKLIADHVQDLIGVMDGFEVGRAWVCGVSVGGVIALGLSEAAPQRVERLVLCCTGAKIGTADSWNARISAVEQGGVAAVSEEVLKRWLPPAVHAADAPELALARNMLSRTPAAGYNATCVALRDSDLTGAARAVRVPALCIAGELDGSTPPALVRALAALVPGARYHEIAGAGHLPCLQTPAALADEIQAFAGL
jgi:3-oxoadipate enol-lactonase